MCRILDDYFPTVNFNINKSSMLHWIDIQIYKI